MPNPWEELLERARPQINPQTFSTWLQPARFDGMNGNGRIRVRVPNEEFKVYITENFSSLLSEHLTGRASGIEFFHEEPAAAHAEPEPELEAPLESLSKCPEAPEEAWYGPAALYRDILGPRVESSDNYHLGCFLTLVGAALGKSVYMNVSKIVYPNFYTVLVGDSAWGRKGVAMAPIYDLAPEINPGIIPFSSVDSSEGLIRAIDEAQEHSTEKSQAAVLITLDEYNSMLAKAKQKGSKIIPDLKRAFDSPPTLEVNSSLRRSHIKNPPTVSMLAASEPDDLADIDPRDLKGGMGNRPIYIPGESKPPNPKSTAPSYGEWTPLVTEIRKTVEFYGHMGSTRLKWSEGAYPLWEKFYKAARKRGANDPLVHKLAARHCVYVPKTAMIFAALDREEKFVREPHIEAAIAWCGFLLDSLYYIFRNVDIKPWVRESKDIADYVRRQKAVPYVKLQRRFHRLGAETFERRMKYLLADRAHPERELAIDERIGISGRISRWVVPNE